MKIFKRVLIGCIGAVVLALIVLAVVAGVFVALGPPESRPGSADEETKIASGRLAVPEPAAGEVPSPSSTVAIELRLEEGQFDVRPGPPGSGVRVEADYDEGLYLLEQEAQAGEGGADVVRVRFTARYSALRRLLTRGDLESRNRVTVYLPPDVVMSLKADISKGQSRVDLSGLPIARADLVFRMGEHRLRWDEPNPVGMERLDLSASMGDFQARGLGNARFRELRVSGSMGAVDLDLRGDYRADATVQASHRMGELRITVPSDVRVETINAVFLGEVRSDRPDGPEPPSSAPLLKVVSSISLGELRVERD